MKKKIKAEKKYKKSVGSWKKSLFVFGFSMESPFAAIFLYSLDFVSPVAWNSVVVILKNEGFSYLKKIYW